MAGGHRSRSTDAERVKDTYELRRTVEQRLDALRKVNELRAPLWEAVAAELGRGNGKGSFARRAAAVGKRMQKGFDRFDAGELTRAKAIKHYEGELAELRDEFEAASVDALWRHARLHPSTPELVAAWLDRRIGDDADTVRIDKYLGWHFQHPVAPPSDVGTIEQGLGDPAPAPAPPGTCAFPPHVVQDDRVWSQGISEGNFARSTPSAGAVAVNVTGNLAGGSSAHSLVGADFAIPAGFTNITATANINWISPGGRSPSAVAPAPALTSSCGSRTPPAQRPRRRARPSTRWSRR